MLHAEDIYQLIQPFVTKDLILPRSLDEIKKNITNFIEINDNSKLIACAGIKYYPNQVAEIYAFSIDSNYQNHGLSKKLLTKIEISVKKKCIKQVFALSKYQTNWFIHQGFLKTTLDALPVEKQQQYNNRRQSNIFIKNIN